ncbi:hypothetical protein [Crenothrix polyspora]|uniref:Methyltransferase FkbM domain-containing protein n=1 Tax=Crenothrix polyspora TaxID=360316 RepID=A0A1R4GYC0_9GAMM|nr:hypothetical protein [Crenothrix polyspora]SJM88986.1 hypothetical protein CRENPOLYSF1_10016 [Crenothrix polyspora]
MLPVKQWLHNLSNKFQKATLTPHNIAETTSPKHVHLHWHVSELTKIVSEFVSNSILIEGNAPVTIQPSQALSHDENLLEKARTQWQFGDWESLTQINVSDIEHHPERAKLALLVSCAWQQLNDFIAARQYLKLAKEWGCDKKLIAQLLIAGVHNTLGRAATLLGGDEKRALNHFQCSVKGINGDLKLIHQVRTQQELTRLGLISQSMPLLGQQSTDTRQTATFSGQQKILALMKSMSPRVMRTRKKVRIGGDHDGGYVVPDCVLQCDSAISIGIGDNVSFDLELANHGIKVLQFDHTVDAPPISHPKFVFEKKGWGRHTEGDFLDFNALFSRFKSISPGRALLKFDIEGDEYATLATTDSNLLAYFDIIVCEIHWLDRLVDPVFFEGVHQAINKLITHHVPVHWHANNFAGVSLVEGVSIPQVLEISFLRRNLDVFGEFLLKPIPEVLDSQNDPSTPDILIPTECYIL